MMRCPLGHPPGPQPFCPICGRAMVEAADEPETPFTETVTPADDQTPTATEQVFDLDVEYAAPAAPPPPPAAPAGPPAGGAVPSAPVTGPTWSDFADTPASGSAAAETQRLIEELQAGRPVLPPTFPGGEGSGDPGPAGGLQTSWSTAGQPVPPAPVDPTAVAPAAPTPLPSVPAGPTPPAAPPAPPAPPSPPPPAPLDPRFDAGVFPAADLPDYAPLPPQEAPPLPPPAPGPPPPPASPVRPAAERRPVEPPSVLDDFADDRDTEQRAPGRSKVLPYLLVGVVLAAAAYFATTTLGGSSDDTETLTQPSPRAPRATATRPVPQASYSAEQIAASLKNPGFKYGYDAGVRRAKAGAVTDPQGTCRAMAFRERQNGYPWGAQSQQGCIVGITTR